MEYLAKAFHAGIKYEAHVTVVPANWSAEELDAEFCTSFCFVNDAIETLDEKASEAVQLMLLDDACDQYIAEEC